MLKPNKWLKHLEDIFFYKDNAVVRKLSIKPILCFSFFYVFFVSNGKRNRLYLTSLQLVLMHRPFDIHAPTGLGIAETERGLSGVILIESRQLCPGSSVDVPGFSISCTKQPKEIPELLAGIYLDIVQCNPLSFFIHSQNGECHNVQIVRV